MNFLIHTGAGIGDMVQKLPMARAIKEEYPDANVDFLMNGTASRCEQNRNIIDCQHYVRNLYRYDVKDKIHCAGLLLRLMMNRYDFGFVRDAGTAVNNAVPSFWVFRIMRWSGCRKVAGFLKEQADVYVDIPGRTHYLECDRLTLKAIGINRTMKADTIDASLTDRSILSSLNAERKIIALSVGTNIYAWTENGKTIEYDVKSWAYDKWIMLACELVNSGYDVILLGGRKESDELQERGINIPDSEHIKNFIGKTTLKQSLALLSKSSLAAGAEGGMMHCAAGLGIRTLTIMGGSDYKQWTPANGEIVNLFYDCAPCFSAKRASECKYHRCLEDISVEMVLGKILSMKI